MVFYRFCPEKSEVCLERALIRLLKMADPMADEVVVDQQLVEFQEEDGGEETGGPEHMPLPPDDDDEDMEEGEVSDGGPAAGARSRIGADRAAKTPRKAIQITIQNQEKQDLPVTTFLS